MPLVVKCNHTEGIHNATLTMDDEIDHVLTDSGPSALPPMSIISSEVGQIRRSSSSISSSAFTSTSSTHTHSLLRSQYQRNLDVYTANNNNNLSSCVSLCNNPSRDNFSTADGEQKQNRCIEISRDTLDLATFGHKAGCLLFDPTEESKPLSVKARESASKWCRQLSPLACFRSLFPIVDWLPKYSVRSNLLADIIAGITVSILHIPQGIAYSLLAGLGPVNGLYVSFFPVLVYVLMGTSPHISIGTFAIASIMLNNIATKMGAVNEPSLTNASSTLFDMAQNYSETFPALVENNNLTDTLQGIDPPRTIEVLTSVCLLCGFIQIAMGFLRLGSLSLILSEHLVSAFSTAIAFHVATSQFAYIFGFEALPRAKSGPLKLIKSWIIMFEHIQSANVKSLIFSGIMIAILVLFKELIEPRLKKRNSFPIPIDLLLVIFSILMSWLFKFNRHFAIQVVKNVPTGLPKPTVPRFDLMPSLFADSVILSIVCFAVSLSLAKIFAKKHNYRVDANQELVALGSANVFSSFFLAYPCSAALSRSTLQEKVGGKTQIAGLVSCAIILTVLLLLAPFLYHLPKCTLSCIILVALKGMFMQISDLPLFWRISKLDGTVWLVTFLSVVILDIDLGLIAGISISILTLLIRLAIPKMNWLGQLTTTEIYAETEAYRALDTYSGIKIFRLGSPLFYLNTEVFKDTILAAFLPDDSNRLIGQSSGKSSKTLIIDLSGVSFIDKPGIDTLVEVVRTLQKQQVTTCLTMCPFHLVDSLKRVTFEEKVKHSTYPCRLYPSIHDAVVDSL